MKQRPTATTTETSIYTQYHRDEKAIISRRATIRHHH